MAHQWIIDSTTLMSNFISVFQESRDIQFRTKVCCAVAYWIHICPMHFDGQPQLCSLVVRLKTIAEEVSDEIRTRLDVSNLPSYAWMRVVSVRHPINRQLQVSLSFEQWSPEDISTSLSHIDFKMLSRITIAELKRYVKDGNLKDTPVLERSISVFNNLSNWVQCMILSKPTPKERADIITKFVKVGKHLRRLNNFNTLMAVVGGITHSCVARLSKTNCLLTADINKELTQLTNLLSVRSNFAEYRKALAATGSQFRIPIIGVHLKDLIATQSGGNCFERTGSISIKKIERLASLLSYFLIFNQKTHNVPDANLDLINTLKVSLDIRYNEEDVYALSLRREPRTFMAFEPTTRPVVFADWASGVSSVPDPETVNKHIAAMVEAVFKHYDHDRDGYISQVEFRQIAGNFPFIESFGTIDVDRDGKISREEMEKYFINANKDSMEFRKGFKHDFHLTTFLTPTTCGHCGRLLWGLLRQGNKCKICGLSVHSYCKGEVVVECRRKQSTGGPFARTTEWLGSPRGGSIRNKLFLSYKKSSNRLRTVSTSSSPEPSPSVGNVVDETLGGRLKPPTIRTLRPQSESVDCYLSKSRGLSPDNETEHGLVSLACEEVFEDDSSAT
ncbi:hypothetical protein WR25_09956 [Diploscapter pachys]|uniref:Ras guanyl-releasing protein 3 n=1 Tax=Diploscapter pachys TaxID=2018661 RepID=A0A2A2JDQ5_9BILA|nr:hypothetical protein WR25_09956 [Diploscapter pachys]